MSKKLTEFSRDDAQVKFIFDHVRNIGIAGLVFAAAIWKAKNVAIGWVAFLDYLAVGLLFCCGVLLVIINQENLLHRIRQSSLATWGKGIVGGSYGLLLSMLISYGTRGL